MDKWEEATHPRSSKSLIVFFVIGFTEIEVCGFQVLQVSSPDHHQLGKAWVEPRGFVVSEVSWIVRLEESSELRGDVGLVLFSIGFRKIRFGLGISENEEVFDQIDSWTNNSSTNFHSSHFSFKAFKMLLVVLLLDSSKVCPAPKRLRWATVLPQQLLASLGALHVQAMDSACIGFTTLHHRPLVMKGESKLQSIRKPTAFHSTHTRYKS